MGVSLRRTASWIAWTLALPLLSGAGCASGSDVAPRRSPEPAVSAALEANGGEGADRRVSAAEVPSEDPYRPAPPLRPLPNAALAQLRSGIDEHLGKYPMSRALTSALIVQSGTGAIIYERQADAAVIPASNVKLFTTAAALSRLGPDHRFPVTVYATSPMGSDGIVHGDLILLGEHDFSGSTYFHAKASFELQQIATRLAGLGLAAVAGKVWVRGEFVYQGDPHSQYDPPMQRAMVATMFRLALVRQGIRVGEALSGPGFRPPSGAQRLLTWQAIPLGVGCSPINRTSHNLFADILNRHLGWIQSGRSTYEAGGAATKAFLHAIGTDVSQVRFADGSGYSRHNRASARHVVQLLEYMQTQHAGATWARTFAVAGHRGTLENRMTGPDTARRVYGKTGTLRDVISLSGYLDHRHDGQRYLFSLLMNQVADTMLARWTQNRIVEHLARDLRLRGTRPSPPVLQMVKNDGNGRTVTASWQPVVAAAGYLLWRSRDGRVWERSQARYVSTTTHRTKVFPDSPRLYLRVTAVNDAGESDSSDVYGARAYSSASPVLIVDGNDRWEGEPAQENAFHGGHDFALRHADAIADVAYDSCANEVITAGAVELGAYPAVIWTVGEECKEHEAFSSAEQAKLRTYVAAGGNLLVSGSEIGWDLVDQGSPADRRFHEEVLHASYEGDEAKTYVARGGGGILAGLPHVGFHTPDHMVIEHADQLAPRDGAIPILSYVGGRGGHAAIQYDGDHRVVYLGFPFECVDNAIDRRSIMKAVLTFFELP